MIGQEAHEEIVSNLIHVNWRLETPHIRAHQIGDKEGMEVSDLETKELELEGLV